MQAKHVARRTISTASMAVAGVFLLAACATSFSGGGWIRSVNEVDKANITINFKCTELVEGGAECNGGSAHGTYHDKGIGVRLKWDGVLFAYGPGLGLDNCMSGLLNYTSQDAKRAGSGEAYVAACDLGEPGRGIDFVGISILSGPYEGYANEGELQGGNFQAK